MSIPQREKLIDWRQLNYKYEIYDYTAAAQRKFRLNPHRERNLPAVLSRDEINVIIDATPNLKHKAIIATMYSSGLRVSEVVHLHYDDISRTTVTDPFSVKIGIYHT